MIELPALSSSAMSSSVGKALRGKGMHILSKTTHELPQISVTGIKEMSSYQIPPVPPTETRTPRVYLISSTDSAPGSPNNTTNELSLHHEIVKLLQEDFNLHIGNVNKRRRQSHAALETILSRPKPLRQFTISNADVCIYLFTNTTLEDANCFHDLCTAIALKTPVIYLKNCKDDLPTTFAECVQRNSHGCVSFTEYIEKYVLDKKEPQIQAVQKRNTIRPNNRLAPLAVRCRPASASELNVRGVDIRKGRRKQTSADSTDLLVNFRNNFKSALFFDDTDRFHFSDMLKRCIQKVVGSSLDGGSEFYHSVFDNANSNSHSEFVFKNATNGKLSKSRQLSGQISSGSLKLPETEVMVSTREWGSPGTILTSTIDDSEPSKDGRFSYDIRMVSPLPLEEKATTYLIFKDKFSPDGIRRINYPVEEDELEDNCNDLDDSDEFDPGGSPIHIQDIDLAREVNKAMDTPDSDM